MGTSTLTLEGKLTGKHRAYWAEYAGELAADLKPVIEQAILKSGPDTGQRQH
jgi:hypothetical protein